MNAPGNSSRSPADRGFVIVAVLWILLALSSLAKQLLVNSACWLPRPPVRKNQPTGT